MGLLRAIAIGLAPPLCAACTRPCEPGAILCAACDERLHAAHPLFSAGPPGVDRAWSAAPHDGVARALASALKYRRLLPVAGLMAERVHRLAPDIVLSGEVVPVPTAPGRVLRRGFDPALELATALATRAALPLRPCLSRSGAGRQVGRGRARRLGSPPRIHAALPPPRSVLLVDDVLTTGATLSACAAALRAAGSTRVVAVTFARRP